MIFEVPIDHFPAQQKVSRTSSRPLRLSNISLPSKEINCAVVPLSPIVIRRSPFDFSPSISKSSLPTAVRATIPPLKRALTSPALPVHHINLNQIRKASTPSSTSRTNSVSDLLKMPSKLLSSAVSLHQLG